MKSIGSSILVLSACVTFSAAAFVRVEAEGLFLKIVGFVVGVVGLHGWFASSKSDSHEK
ncbi:MAG: hypothetical protein ACQESR_21240 [Planctomycetota bacterium]